MAYGSGYGAPSRRTQPYRKGGVRPRGGAFSAMLEGKAKGRPHPQDAKRRAAKGHRGAKRRMRHLLG